MLTSQLILIYLNAVVEGLKADALVKDQKLPVNSIRIEVSEEKGTLYAPDYMQYIIEGRPPGKQPPPEAMLEYVRKNLHILDSARDIYRNISEQSLAYMIGRKIGRYGSDVYQGKKPKIDLNLVIQAQLPDFLKQLAFWEAFNIAKKIRQVA